MDAREATDRAEPDSGVSRAETVGDLTVVTTADQPEPSRRSAADGGDVGRDPDAIAREIEQTRVELADTIDAIANRISPKKAAARGVQAVKSHVPGAAGDAGDPAAAASPGPASGLATSSPRVVPIAAVAGLIVVVLLFVRRRRGR